LKEGDVTIEMRFVIGGIEVERGCFVSCRIMLVENASDGERGSILRKE
jgi:hypothetical protein